MSQNKSISYIFIGYKQFIITRCRSAVSVDSATQIKDGSSQRSVDIYKQIQQDNKEYLLKISTMVKNGERWNERQNAKNMLDL